MKNNVNELRNLISDDLDASELLDELENEIDDIVEDLKEQISTLESKNEDLEGDLDNQINIKKSTYQVNCPLGSIYIYCDTGNLKLQEHIESFLSNVKKRYS